MFKRKFIAEKTVLSVGETNFLKAIGISNHLLDKINGQESDRGYNGFDENFEGADLVAVIMKPCGCCTKLWALDDVPEAVQELTRFYKDEDTPLRFPGVPGDGRQTFLGVFRKIS